MNAVGICLTRQGATLAVVEWSSSGWQIVAVADVIWPEADPGAVTGSPAAARLLRRARRQLKLPARQAVALTAVPADLDVLDLPGVAVLLACADLVRCWSIAPDRAGRAGHEALAGLDPIRDPRLAQVAATESAHLAAGAAIAALRPDAPATASVPEPSPVPEAFPVPEPVPVSEPFPVPELVPVPEPFPAPETASDPEPASIAAPDLPRIGWAVQRVVDQVPIGAGGNLLPR